MRKKPAARVRETPAQYYDARGVLGEIEDEAVDVTLDEALRADIVEGRRARRLQNVSIKLDPAHIQAVRKIATMKAVPYQTLIRQWLAEAVRRELKLGEAPRRPARTRRASR